MKWIYVETILKKEKQMCDSEDKVYYQEQEALDKFNIEIEERDNRYLYGN